MFFSNYSLPVKSLLVALLISSPWLVVQAGIIVLAPDDEIKNMPSCEQDSGNCAHLGGGDDYRMNSTLKTKFSKNISVMTQLLEDYIGEQGSEIIYQLEEENSAYFHLVEKTKFWQFPDDVIVKISQSDDGCILEMHSKSRLGWGDIGVNPERLENIHSYFSD